MTATSFRTSVDLPPLVLPGSPHYDTARRAWSLHVDLRPAAVCVATRVELQSAVGYARAHGLRVAAQTTGHQAYVLTCIDPRAALATLAVLDPARTARADAGKLLAAPQLAPQVAVSGYAYDIKTGLLTQVAAPRRRAGHPASAA